MLFIAHAWVFSFSLDIFKMNSCSVISHYVSACRCTTGSGTLNAFIEWRWRSCLIIASAHQRSGRPLPSSTSLHPFIKRLKCECPSSNAQWASLNEPWGHFISLSCICCHISSRFNSGFSHFISKPVTLTVVSVCEGHSDTVQTWMKRLCKSLTLPPQISDVPSSVSPLSRCANLRLPFCVFLSPQGSTLTYLPLRRSGLLSLSTWFITPVERPGKVS